MPQKSKEFFQRLAPAFERERTICRVIAAWCAFVAIKLLFSEGKYYDLSFAQETSVLAMVGIILLFFLAFTAVSALLPRFETDTWFLLLGATVCVVHWLGTYKGNKNITLVLLAVIVAYAFFLIYCIYRNAGLFSVNRPSGSEHEEAVVDCSVAEASANANKGWGNLLHPGKRTTMTFAVVCGLIGAAVIAAITCYRYLTFASPNFDFGLFVNMFHNMKETGLPLVTSERDALMSHFAVHISPIYYVLLPFYCIFPSPLTLQIGQAVVLASGVFPVLLLARQFKLSGRAQMLITLMYALYPALSAGCFYDIHENCFLAPLLLWMFYFFEREEYLPMYLFAIAVLLVKEDAAMYVIMFALYVLLSRKKYGHGTILALGALTYFGLACWLLSTYGDGVMVNRFNNLIFDKEEGLWGAVKTALFNPGYLLTQLFTTSKNTWDKMVYVLQIFLPLGFLPFITKKPSRWLLMMPLLMNLLTYYQYQYDITFQYSFGVTAFLMYATIQNVADLKAPSRRYLVSLGAAACCCFYIVTVYPKLTTYTTRYEKNRETYEHMEMLLDTIPEDASLNISTFLLPHVADRDIIYEVNYHGDKPDVDYVVIDMRPGYFNDKAIAHRDAYLAHGYTITEEHKDFLLIMEKP